MSTVKKMWPISCRSVLSSFLQKTFLYLCSKQVFFRRIVLPCSLRSRRWVQSPVIQQWQHLPNEFHSLENSLQKTNQAINIYDVQDNKFRLQVMKISRDFQLKRMCNIGFHTKEKEKKQRLPQIADKTGKANFTNSKRAAGRQGQQERTFSSWYISRKTEGRKIRLFTEKTCLPAVNHRRGSIVMWLP